jgi:hypothetical protein
MRGGLAPATALRDETGRNVGRAARREPDNSKKSSRTSAAMVKRVFHPEESYASFDKYQATDRFGTGHFTNIHRFRCRCRFAQPMFARHAQWDASRFLGERRKMANISDTDFLAETVRYRVPSDRLDDLGRYDGSVWFQRTRGELTAQCDMEELNNLALNLANEVVTRWRTVDDARAFYAMTAMAFKQGDRSSPYLNGLRFTPQLSNADPDHPAK